MSATPERLVHWANVLPNESDLVRDLQSINPTRQAHGFSSLIRGYAPDVLRYTYSFAHNWTAAEDATQETFLKSWATRDSYKPKSDTPYKGWLIRVARNCIIDIQRKEKRLVLVSDVHPSGYEALTEADASINRMDFNNSLDALLAGLDPINAAVWSRRAIQGLSPGEIAKSLDMSQDAVHARYHRSQREARQVFEEAGLTPQVHAA